MIDKKAFAKMRSEIEKFDDLRDQLIKDSRDVLKLSKASIYSIHRTDIKTADKQLKDAKNQIKKIELLIKKDVHLAQVGAFGEALEEYVEAACYFSYVKNKKLPTAQSLGVKTDVFLMGVCDLVGELVRKAVNAAANNDYKTPLEIKEFVNEIHNELILFNFRNTPVRRKFDNIKYGLEKLEDLNLRIKLK